MQELDLLDAFMRVYQRGSITAAAADLGVSQPTLTDRISRLEARLGLPLFERSRRGTRPTPAAERLAAQVGEPLVRLRQVMRADASAPPGAASGLGPAPVLRLAGPAEITTMRVIPALAPLLEGGLAIHITLGLADDLLAGLADGQFDLAVSAIRPKVSGVHSVSLVDEEFVLVGSPGQVRSIHPAELATNPVAALAHLPLVAYAPELPIVRRYWRTLFNQRPPNRVALIVPDLRGVLAAVIAGIGISVLPRAIAQAALDSGSIRLLHRSEELPLNTVYLAWRSGEEGEAVMAVRERLLEAAGEWGML